MITRKEAWLKIAGEFEKPESDSVFRLGLCAAIRHVYLDNEITDETYYAIAAREKSLPRVGQGGIDAFDLFMFPLDDRQSRAQLARKLAAESE